ncbi:MAG: hypothetical protein ABI321_02225 [Polyangia bacterium]
MRALLVSVLLLAACGDGTISNCACTVTVGDASVQLKCGESTCLAYSGFGCDDDEVVPIGPCGHDFAQVTLVDSGDPDSGGACVPAGAACAGTSAPCCTTPSGTGPLSPSCDPTTQKCCVATGQACSQSADCCGIRTCIVLSGQQVCGS